MAHESAPAHRRRDLDTSDWQSGFLSATLDYRHKQAGAVLRDHLQEVPNDSDAKIAMALNLAGEGLYREASSILQDVSDDALAPPSKAILNVVKSYPSITGVQDSSQRRRLLELAVELDPGSVIALLALGRLQLWQERDVAGAREVFSRALAIAPKAVATAENMIALEAHCGDFRAARNLASRMFAQGKARVDALLLLTVTGVLSTPLRGLVVMLAASLAVFTPVLGPGIYGLFASVAILSKAKLRRLGPLLSSTPTRWWVGLSAMYLVRFLIVGKLLP